MGRADYLKLGDWNVTCDRCGFKRKRSECRVTWDNLLVCSDTCWEPRHPQDFVRSKPDRMRVPIARPDSQTLQRTTTLSASASKDAISISVASISNISRYDGIGITLDNAEGLIQWTYADPAPSGTTVYLANALLDAASSGNTVYISSGTRFVTATEITASNL